MNVTASMALKLIPESLRSQPVFFCIDDTMVSKFGKKFEDVSKLFDHAAHNGSNYLNGHCFVSLMLCVPVWNGSKIVYISIPLGYRMWQKEESKLKLASSAMQGMTLSFMTLHLSRPGKGEDLRSMENVFRQKQIFLLPMRKSVIITLVYGGFLQISSAAGKSLPM